MRILEIPRLEVQGFEGVALKRPACRERGVGVPGLVPIEDALSQGVRELQLFLGLRKTPSGQPFDDGRSVLEGQGLGQVVLNARKGWERRRKGFGRRKQDQHERKVGDKGSIFPP